MNNFIANTLVLAKQDHGQCGSSRCEFAFIRDANQKDFKTECRFARCLIEMVENTEAEILRLKEFEFIYKGLCK